MVALWAMAETVASSDLSEDATFPIKQNVTHQYHTHPDSFQQMPECKAQNIPVAVAKAILIECSAALASDKTLFSALAIVLFSAACADNADASARELCAACEAAAPVSVCAALSDEMMAAAWLAAAALVLLAAAIMEAALSVAATMLGCAEARALRPARRRAVTRMLIEVENILNLWA